MTPDPTTALVPVADDESPLPIFSGPQMVRAFEAYRELQAALDRAMPDQLQKIGEKVFRKKGFWKATSTSFGLTVEFVEERREVFGTFDDGRENFGYVVLYRATTQNGRRSATGDGAATAVEKAEKFRCPHPAEGRENWSLHYPPERCPDFDPEYRWRMLPVQATEHNVRSHAHTRAANRAISNLVAFGEVSYEEAERDDDLARDRDEPHDTARPASTPTHGPSGNSSRRAVPISDKQAKRLWAIARGAGWTEAEVKTHLARYGFEHTDTITADKYDAIVSDLEHGVDGTREA
jgi:hypothetical protein